MLDTLPDTPAPPLLLAQLSDLHVGTGEDFLGGLMDTTAALHRAVAHVLSLPTVPDAVLLTGDLTEHGRAAEYACLAAALRPLAMPVYAVPGNHDDPAAARAALPDAMPLDPGAPPGACCYQRRLGALHLLALDSVVPRVRMASSARPSSTGWRRRWTVAAASRC